MLDGSPVNDPSPERRHAAADGAMTQSSATPSLPDQPRARCGCSRRVAGLGAHRGVRARAAADPGRRGGLDVLRRHDVGLLSPFPVLILTVVYSAYVGRAAARRW